MKDVFFHTSVLASYMHVPGVLRSNTCVIDCQLCFGPVKDGVVSDQRKTFFYKNFRKEIYGSKLGKKRPRTEKEFGWFWEYIVDCYKRALHLPNEKEIRIWYSDKPYELSGLYYVCSLIDGSDVKVSIVYQGDFDKQLNGWGGYCAEQLKEALSLTKTLADDKIHEFAGKWHKLCEENQNFRTVKEGELVSSFVDFRDGLTPIQRSILYAMSEAGLSNNNACKKSGKIVNDVLWHYELFGDYFVYGQIARMTQKFVTPYPLISGQGDFGKRRRPHADAYHKTKIKLSKIGEKLLENVHSAKVPFVPPFARDGGLAKPEYLPGDFPNVFCNGNYNLIPHKLENVTKMLGAYAKNPDISIEELTSLIGEPNYTDGRIILNPDELPEIYRTGKGFLRYKYTDSEQEFEDEINYTLLKDGEGVLMNLKELVKNYSDYRGRIER